MPVGSGPKTLMLPSLVDFVSPRFHLLDAILAEPGTAGIVNKPQAELIKTACITQSIDYMAHFGDQDEGAIGQVTGNFPGGGRRRHGIVGAGEDQGGDFGLYRVEEAFGYFTARPVCTGLALLADPVAAHEGMGGERGDFSRINKGDVFRAGDAEVKPFGQELAGIRPAGVEGDEGLEVSDKSLVNEVGDLSQPGRSV